MLLDGEYQRLLALASAHAENNRETYLPGQIGGSRISAGPDDGTHADVGSL